MSKILFTGGSGLLGSEMQKIYREELFPNSKAFDVTSFVNMYKFFIQLENSEHAIDTIVHMAAITSPPYIEKNIIRAIDTNIIGTANIAKLCFENNLRLVYISTDYVFNGESGNYSESDPVLPNNRYAWTKLAGECAVRMHNNYIIIRLSFGPNEFPYDGAFIDQWTSREKVSASAIKIAKIINKKIKGTMHIGAKRRTVYEYAKKVSPDKSIKELSIENMDVKMPKDTSLDVSLYNFIFG